MDGIIDRLSGILFGQYLKAACSFKDVKVESFQSIPDNAYRTDYVNFLLTCFMAQQDTEKVMNSFSNLNERQLVPSKKPCGNILISVITGMSGILPWHRTARSLLKVAGLTVTCHKQQFS